MDAMARSGIGVYGDTSSPTPDKALPGLQSPLKLLEFQAHALAVGAWTGSSYTGAELDTLLPSPPQDVVMPTTAELVAGYVAAADTPGGAMSRALMAGQDLLSPQDLRFPAVVLVLFASDLATGGGGSAVGATRSTALDASYRVVSKTSGAAQFLPVALVSSTICSDTANWIQGTVSSLFDALKAATPDNLPGRIVVSIWNWLVDKAQSLVQGLLKSVTDAVLGTVRSIAATIATVAEQIASLAPYGLRATAINETGGGTFMLGLDPLPGRYNASVSMGDLPAWPAVLSDCASVGNIALPDFNAKLVPLTWGPLRAPADPLLTPDGTARTDDVTDAIGQANWRFNTSVDPGGPNEEQENQVDAMPVTVHRPEVVAAAQRLNAALLGSIPGILQPFVGALFAPYISGLQDRINKLLDARGTATAVLVFHAKPKPTPTPPQTPPATPAASASCGVQPGSYTGTTANVSSETIDQGTFGATVDHTTGAGTITMSVARDGSVTGEWTMRTADIFNETASANGVATVKYHRESTTDFAGSAGGSVCALQLTFTSVKVVSCVDSVKGDCSGEGVPTGTSPAPGGLGGPSSTSAGQATWTFHYSSDAGAVVADDLTISVKNATP